MLMIHMRVIPANCQVALIVPDATEDPPGWPTGHELVVANSGTIYVSTICERGGEVEIKAWWGTFPDELERQEPLYDGILEVRDAGVLVGSYMGAHLGHANMLREGKHRVRVYTDPPGPEPVRVSFVID